MSAEAPPFEHKEWPFEFTVPESPEDETYLKFGWVPGEPIPGGVDRNPGSYPFGGSFVKDASIRDTSIRRDTLDDARVSVCRYIRKWLALRARAQVERERSSAEYDFEKARLLVIISGDDVNITHPMAGEVKKTEATKMAWVQRQPTYREMRAWRYHADAQYDYVDGIVRALQDKVRIMEGFANDQRVESRMMYVEPGQQQQG